MINPTDKKIDFWAASAIGIGGMVGGGIFAVLGLAVSLAKGATPLAFCIAGFLALITSYSYVKLSLAYPDKGGTVKFINQGFGKSIFSGGINNLLWISYIIMLALYASAFGFYAPNLFAFTNSNSLDFHIYASAIIVIASLINYYSINVVGKIESYAVFIKLIILLLFVIAGIYGLFNNENLTQLSIHNWESPIHLIAGGMVIFVAYEGFELIANAAPDISNPVKNIPKAYYYSVIFVILLYIAIAFVTVGSLPFNKIAIAQDYVLAEASKPLLGQAGFMIITIAALISTFSAINASLLGGSRVSYEIGEDDELPHQFTYNLWNHPIGLMITIVLTLLLTNTLNLEAISTAGSIGFIIIFAMVNLTGFKLSKKILGNRIIPLVGFLLCIVALFVLIIQQYSRSHLAVEVAFSIISIAFLIEYIYKKSERYRMKKNYNNP